MDSKSLIIYDCDDFKVRLEYNDEFAILHLPTVEKFNKSVLIKMQNKVVELLDFFYDLGYNGIWTGCYEDNETIKKLIVALGFNYVKEENSYSIYNIGVN